VIDSRPDTYRHSLRVGELVGQVVAELVGRMTQHDLSKTEPPELEMFDQMTARLDQLEYGTPEYEECRREMLGQALAHHYEHNRHHPEHYGANGINDMTLVDLVEMLCDWKAATERMKAGTGDLQVSFDVNKGRFGISDQLQRVLINTARECGWIE
jgi:hypothetical protein